MVSVIVASASWQALDEHVVELCGDAVGLDGEDTVPCRRQKVVTREFQRTRVLGAHVLVSVPVNHLCGLSPSFIPRFPVGPLQRVGSGSRATVTVTPPQRHS